MKTRIQLPQLTEAFTKSECIQDNRFMVINGVLIEIQLLAWSAPEDQGVVGVPMKNQFHYITVWDAETVFNPGEAEDLKLTYNDPEQYLKAIYEITDEAEAMTCFWELGKRAFEHGSVLLEQLVAE
jgi:hypothetical protein